MTDASGRLRGRGIASHLHARCLTARSEGSDSLHSSPEWAARVSQGNEVESPTARVSNWLHLEHGRAEGAATVRLLRSRMSIEERRGHDSGYPFRFG